MRRQRLYLVAETVLVHGTTEVWATSKESAKQKVKDAYFSDDPYVFEYEPGPTIGQLIAELDLDRCGKPIYRAPDDPEQPLGRR